jgi:hypothetical protein
MRRIFVGLTMLIVASAADTASAEILYPWCKQPAEGGNNCGFSTLEQCQAGGTGGFCIENPRYQGRANASRPYMEAPPNKHPSR